MNKKTNLTANMIVKNEEKWVWFAIMSVISYVDQIIIFDTGSTDNTVKIIEDILQNSEYRNKIIFEKKGLVNPIEFTELRQEQLERTKTKWFLVIDGDEIWYGDTIKALVDFINSPNNPHTMVAINFHNCVGDVFHYKDFKSESYKIKGVVGSITIRAFSKDIKGIHCGGIYGVEGYIDENNIPVQADENSIFILDGFYLHTSYLQRSSSILRDWEIPYRRQKVFTRLTNRVDEKFIFPEVFKLTRPAIVSSPYKKMGFKYYFFRFFYLAHKLIYKVINK